MSANILLGGQAGCYISEAWLEFVFCLFVCCHAANFLFDAETKALQELQATCEQLKGMRTMALTV
jgi:uncharacterized membrane protein YfcA